METVRNCVVYGYARVSSADQNADRQLIALTNAGVVKQQIFVDHRSGKDFNRPAWRKLVRKLRTGDVVVVTSLDRFGRNYEEMLTQWRDLVKIRGVHIRVLDMPLLDTTTGQGLLAVFIADLVLQILSFVAQSERDHIHERQRQGIAAAKARGVKFGRAPMVLPSAFDDLVGRVRRHELSLRKAARLCGMSHTSFRKYMRD